MRLTTRNKGFSSGASLWNRSQPSSMIRRCLQGAELCHECGFTGCDHPLFKDEGCSQGVSMLLWLLSSAPSALRARGRPFLFATLFSTAKTSTCYAGLQRFCHRFEALCRLRGTTSSPLRLVSFQRTMSCLYPSFYRCRRRRSSTSAEDIAFYEGSVRHHTLEHRVHLWTLGVARVCILRRPKIFEGQLQLLEARCSSRGELPFGYFHPLSISDLIMH